MSVDRLEEQITVETLAPMTDIQRGEVIRAVVDCLRDDFGHKECIVSITKNHEAPD